MTRLTATDAANIAEAAKITNAYAEKWGAKVQVFSSEVSDDHLAVVMHDDHVFAAASSKISQGDALIRLSGRIRAKQS